MNQVLYCYFFLDKYFENSPYDVKWTESPQPKINLSNFPLLNCFLKRRESTSFEKIERIKWDKSTFLQDWDRIPLSNLRQTLSWTCFSKIFKRWISINNLLISKKILWKFLFLDFWGKRRSRFSLRMTWWSQQKNSQLYFHFPKVNILFKQDANQEMPNPPSLLHFLISLNPYNLIFGLQTTNLVSLLIKPGMFLAMKIHFWPLSSTNKRDTWLLLKTNKFIFWDI